MITRTNTILAIVIAMMLSVNSKAQESRFSKNKFTTPQGDTLNYRLLYPDIEAKKTYPLVVFLHGAGERGNDNESQLKWGVLSFATDQAMIKYPAFILAPQCPINMHWAIYDKKLDSTTVKLQPFPTKPLELVLALIKHLIVGLPIDTNRIYITGISMGAFGTYDLIERNPKLFAAAVPVCGGGDVTKAPSIAHIPLWIFHGVGDPVVSHHLSLSMVHALTQAGAKPGVTMYPSVGHYAWLGAYADELMMEWLFKQRK